MIFKSLFILIITIAILSCNDSSDKNNQLSTDLIKNPITSEGKSDLSELPLMKFEQIEHNFGAIIQGEKVSYTFKFTNLGKADLIISAANGSCGCTIPKYSKDPIKSGKTGEIEVIFDSSGKSGFQSKTITIISNAQPNSVVLTVSADIIEPK